MRDPVCKSVRVGNLPTVQPESVGKSTTVFGEVYTDAHPKKHARVPPEVYGDTRLTGNDVRVFAAMAQFERGGEFSTGIRCIAQAGGVDSANASRSISRLVEFGHILRVKAGAGKRQSYRLLSPIFNSAAKDAQTGLTCAKCGKVRKVNKACYCSTCATSIRKQFEGINKRVKRQIERLRAAG